MSKKKIIRLQLKDIQEEEGAGELISSPELKPYLEYLRAQMQGADVGLQLEALSKLPLEKRYVWRVASALKWGFADFDSASIAADRHTLNLEDLVKVLDLLRRRPVQFCLFLKALVGVEFMKEMMLDAIAVADNEN